MLNPSKADAKVDDHTVRKCIGFGKIWGCGGIIIVNMYAWRATDPKELARVDDPVGPDNYIALIDHLVNQPIVAWGGSLPKIPQTSATLDIVEIFVRNAKGAQCLGQTKTGQPRHPLMLAYNTPREPWPRSQDVDSNK